MTTATDDVPQGGAGVPEEPPPGPSSWTVMFAQFLLVPLLLVGVSVGIYSAIRWVLIRPEPVARPLRDLSSENARIRWQAAQRLVESGARDPRMVEPLISILRGPAPDGAAPMTWEQWLMDLLKPESTAHWDIRWYAALLLGRSRDPAARAPLEEAASSSDPGLRLFAVAGLMEGGWPESDGILIGAARDAEPMVRAVAAHALGRSGSADAAGALRPLLSDERPEVAWNAALALARHGDPACEPVLQRLLDPTYLDTVRVADAAGREVPLSAPVRRTLQHGAVHAAASLRSGALVTDLKRLGATTSDPDLRVLVQEAVAAIEGRARDGG